VLQVSYEDFRIHMARMYQQYERQQVDHIADPAVRRSRPVSVISGVGSERPSSGGASRAQVTEAKKTANEATQYESVVNGSSDASKEPEPADEIDDAVEKYIEKIVDDAVTIVETRSTARDSQDVNWTTERRPSEPQSESEAVAAEKEAAVTGARSQATSTGDGSGRPSSVSYDKQSTANTPSRQIFSPGPRAPPFRIPEFRWSYLHQKLLSDVLYSLEQDMHAWKM